MQVFLTASQHNVILGNKAWCEVMMPLLVQSASCSSYYCCNPSHTSIDFNQLETQQCQLFIFK